MSPSSVPNSVGPRRELPGDGGEPGHSPRGRGGGPALGPRRGGPAAFNLPPVLKLLIAVMVLVEAAMSFAPAAARDWLFYTLGYIPFWDGAFLPGSLPGLVLHAFLHGGWGHLIMNALWLVIGGKVICQHLDQKRFLLFFAATAVGGALASTVINWGHEMVLMGASGVVFGILGAGAWFWVGHRGDSGQERLKKIAVYVVIMMFLNVAYAYLLSDAGSKVAWEAHAGGFFTGLLVFPLLARRPRGRPSGGQGLGGGLSA
jgi:membrane associated rhomboid family serine protease